MNITAIKHLISTSYDFIIGALFPTDEITYALENIGIDEVLKRPVAEKDSSYPAVFSYKDPIIRNMILSLKYRGSQKIGALFGDIMRTNILEDLSDVALFEGNLPILIIPIPISKIKLESRGYNQSEILCREIVRGNETIFSLRTDILYKKTETKSQSKTKTRKERLVNLSGSFIAKSDLTGKSVIVVDDVCTTGSTLKEATRALKKAGAKKVHCFAIAH